jgi:hypothetical protein
MDIIKRKIRSLILLSGCEGRLESAIFFPV